MQRTGNVVDSNRCEYLSLSARRQLASCALILVFWPGYGMAWHGILHLSYALERASYLASCELNKVLWPGYGMARHGILHLSYALERASYCRQYFFWDAWEIPITVCFKRRAASAPWIDVHEILWVY